jgi:hypothetical protein
MLLVIDMRAGHVGVSFACSPKALAKPGYQWSQSHVHGYYHIERRQTTGIHRYSLAILLIVPLGESAEILNSRMASTSIDQEAYDA